MRKISACLLSVFILTAGPARAAIWPGEWLVSGGVGVAADQASADLPGVWTGGAPSFSARMSGPLIISAQMIYQFTPHWGIGAEYVNRHETGSSADPNGRGTIPSSLSHDILLLTGRYVFTPERDWNPYVTGGIGLDRIELSDNGDHSTAPQTLSFGTPTDATTNLLAGKIGFGAERSVNGSLFAGAEIGFMGVASTSQPVQFTQYPAHLAPELMPYLMARLGFDFGGAGRR